MSRLVLCTALALVWLCAPLWAQPALAQRRIALVIGNSAYKNAPPLPNPVKDAQAIAEGFRKAGFDVVRAFNDLGYLEFSRVIRQFEDDAAEADIAVIYYAGHGLEVHGTNFLVPIDAKLESTGAADDEAITLERLKKSIGEAKQLRLIILDACRDNPFSTAMKRTIASRSVGRGLAQIDISSPNTRSPSRQRPDLLPLMATETARSRWRWRRI